MMMPFVRLIAIYAIVGAAIFAFLKRDEIMASINPPEDPAFANPIAIPFAAPAAQSEEAPNSPEPAPTEAAAAQETAAPAPAFGSQITPQYFGQAAAPTASAPSANNGESMVDRWNKAREVFSQGKTDEAAALYEALTAEFPENMDLHGESGNLYYNLGQFDKAAVHYQAVGEIAGREGNMQMAGNMLSLLQRIAPSNAAKLQAKLNGG